MQEVNKFLEELENKRKQTLGLFDEWSERHPDFKRISDIMENFKTNEMLVEYGKKSPPPSIHNRAIEVFKKCISFKVKLTKKILSHLNQHPDTYHIHYYHSGIYCINEEKVKSFLKEYQLWNLSICNLWKEIYYLKEDFFKNSGYDRLGWEFYIKYPDSLKRKADEIDKLHKKIVSLLNVGMELVHKQDEVITIEYETNATEMSLYERELEILKISDDADSADEEYCYVYTLECELFVFYVGIAATPKERFEQHIRGAFSDEAHLFKSKFIQKYHNEVKQNLIYEGTRRECKKFEKDYISEFNPLGNMTDGGEG
ncbi:MAG: GIY-YIG nuclease family protein [Bacteroidia bacterium]